MKFTNQAKIFAFILSAIIFLIYGSVYVVEQSQQAIVLQFGKPIGEIKSKPGLYFKAPFFLQDVVKYDKRILEVNLEPKTLPDVKQKQVSVDAFIKYKITDALKFYQTVQNYNGLYQKVDSIMMASLKNTLGRIQFQDLLSEKRKSVMNEIKINVSSKAEEFGVKIVDLRIRRADLPRENLNSIFNRMIAEREKEAKEFRAEGEEQAKEIMSRAEKERTISLAEAKRKSEILRGEGDGEASKIFAESYGKDVDFFAFYRAMQAYKESLKSGDTSVVLSPDSEFLQYFRSLDQNGF
ncbi:MAG: protease modulator HflC [Rickettsiales bacterium]|nr:protease modulator HflC [Rickettsiales bacterium]